MRRASILLGLAAACSEPEPPPTFARDIAPIVFEKCTVCHRAGESAPFVLASYDDAKRRGKQIVEVTESRYMPPWLPRAGKHAFLGERRLTEKQIARIRRWVDEGCVEGDPADLPELPTFPSDWQLGEPDLVIRMPEPYELAADGPDVYRNFVIRPSIPATRYVRAIEFHPGNHKVVHHAFVLVDTTSASYLLDEEDPLPGFDGIHASAGAAAPSGFLLSWTPGRAPFPGTPGMSWPLERGTDVVFQLHMQPSGKPESVQAEVGLYFDERPPSLLPVTVGVATKDLDIPAGEAAYTVHASFTLPAAADLLAILPHAHFLGKSMRGLAKLPNGRTEELLDIEQWDFNWQAAYRYADPVRLPKGTELALEFVYDNSAANVWNPNNPPQRVTYGVESTDEMCELWFQLLPVDAQGRALVQQAFERAMMQQVLEDAQRDLARDPDDARALARLGEALLAQRKNAEALDALERAVQLDPKNAEAFLFTAMVHERNGDFLEARRALEDAIRLRPGDFKLHFTLGSLFYRAEKLDLAERSYRDAVRLNPDDFQSNLQLGVVLARGQRLDEALPYFEHCLELRPDSPDAKKNVEQARALLARGRH